MDAVVFELWVRTLSFKGSVDYEAMVWTSSKQLKVKVKNVDSMD